jgi:hypothetical protein
MQVKSAIMMRVLLNRFTKGSPEAALKALPAEEIEQVVKTDISSKDFLPAFEQVMHKIQKIHYSWLIPCIQKLSKEYQVVVIAALPEELGKKVGKRLNFAMTPREVPLMFKNYLIGTIYRQIKGSDQVLPMAYLPPSGMQQLATWSKSELVELIEFMGIHDLSEEIRHIVNKKILQNVYNCLTPKEQQYLKTCMHVKEKMMTPSLGLDKWGGDCNKLKSVLQTRGLVRLGKALSGEHPDLIWHLSHILDTGRGMALSKYYSKKAFAGITNILAQQVGNLINLLKKKSET